MGLLHDVVVNASVPFAFAVAVFTICATVIICWAMTTRNVRATQREAHERKMRESRQLDAKVVADRRVIESD